MFRKQVTTEADRSNQFVQIGIAFDGALPVLAGSIAVVALV